MCVFGDCARCGREFVVVFTLWRMDWSAIGGVAAQQAMQCGRSVDLCNIPGWLGGSCRGSNVVSSWFAIIASLVVLFWC